MEQSAESGGYGDNTHKVTSIKEEQPKVVRSDSSDS